MDGHLGLPSSTTRTFGGFCKPVHCNSCKHGHEDPPVRVLQAPQESWEKLGFVSARGLTSSMKRGGRDVGASTSAAAQNEQSLVHILAARSLHS